MKKFLKNSLGKLSLNDLNPGIILQFNNSYLESWKAFNPGEQLEETGIVIQKFEEKQDYKDERIVDVLILWNSGRLNKEPFVYLKTYYEILK